MELKGEDLWSYSHKIESVSFQKCPHDHLLYNKVYLSSIIVTSIFQSFTYKETSWHTCRYGTKLRHSHPMYTQPGLLGGSSGLAQSVMLVIVVGLLLCLTQSTATSVAMNPAATLACGVKRYSTGSVRRLHFLLSLQCC